MINGGLRLSGGVVVAALVLTGSAGVNTIDGGAGTDTLRVRFTSDATLSSALTLPTNFEQLTLAPDAKMTATLARGIAKIAASPSRVTMFHVKAIRSRQ